MLPRSWVEENYYLHPPPPPAASQIAQWSRTVTVKSLIRVRLLVIPWTGAYHAPQSVGFSRQEYWSGLPFLLQRIFPSQGSNLGLLHCTQMLYHLSHQGSGQEWAYQCWRRRRRGFNPCVGRIPWRRKWQPTLVFLCGKFRGQSF